MVALELELVAAAGAEMALAVAGFAAAGFAAEVGQKEHQMDCLPGPKHRDWIACHWVPMPPPWTQPLIVHWSCSRQSLPRHLTLKAIVVAAAAAVRVGRQTFPELTLAVAAETDCQTFPVMEEAVAVLRTSFPNSTVAVGVGLRTSLAAVAEVAVVVVVVATSSSFQGHS